ncbi:TDT family transporter [Candidatus Sororendozoicomonas aggregata]|uniref:TDT family transporter n=1 Tax=Candidatus Sororendozoicomonas aggregata TaxID=3073239 RepID=UPI002ED2F22E
MEAIQHSPSSDKAKSGGVVDKLSRVPTPMGGLALAIASLGGSWAMVSPEYGTPLKVITALIAAILIVKILLKYLLHSHMLKEELAHPVLASVMPTCAMCAMVIAQVLLPYMPVFAKGLWLVAVICHALLFASFIVHRVIEFKMEHMVPSWFVPPVGIIVAAVTSVGMGHETLVYGLFVFGLACYFIKLPFMLYRLLFRGAIPDAALPTFAIMGAPASLSLAGYLTISDNPEPLLLVILTPLAIFMTALVFMAFIRLLRLPFSPGYAAFTFPVVISATALLKLSAWLSSQNLDWAAERIARLGQLELFIATVIVSYVAICYFYHYLLKPLTKN